MTCQVVLGNGHGVVVASDVTVTVGNNRTHDTAPKIHPIPLPHCLAVLHSGVVNFHGLPYGVLIQEWIRSLGNVQLRHTSAYRDSFLDWLRDNISRTSEEVDREIDAIWSLSEHFGYLHRELVAHLETVPEDQHAWATEQLIKSKVLDLEGRGDLDGHSEARTAATARRVWEFESGQLSLRARLEYWFDDVPRNEAIDSLLEQFVYQQIQKNFSPSGVAHLAFVGFGGDELFANYAHVAIGGSVGRELFSLTSSTAAVNDLWPRQLTRFSAQYDAIDEFLLGYSDALIDQAGSRLSLPDVDGQETSDERDFATSRSLTEAFLKEVSSAAEESRMSSFYQTVSALPLLSLAETAKTLVGLQALKNMIQAATPSVSKTAETALITRAEGFRWLEHLT